MNFRWSFKIGILFILFACKALKAQTFDLEKFIKSQDCGDLMEELAEKPKHLQFVKCDRLNGQTLFEAKYKVVGEKANSVEKFLHKNYGMSSLKFVCCGWETSNGQAGEIKPIQLLPEQGSYVVFSIEMFSEETLINKRKKWDQIEHFYVLVSIILI